MKKIQGVIFDWAGTTVDYGCFAPLDVFIEVFKEIGIDISYKEAREPMGLLKIDHIKALLNMERIEKLWKIKFNRDWNNDDVNKLYERFEIILFENLSNFTTPIPGVLKLMGELRERGIKIGSTTGYTKEMLDIVSKGAKEKGYEPDFKITSTEVKGGRPHPYMIEENLKYFKLSDLNTIIKIGDTISDIKEGKNAGVWAVGILKGGSELGLSQDEVLNMDKETLDKLMDETRLKMLEAGADYVVDEIGDLIDVIDKIEKRLNRCLLLTPGPLSTSFNVREAMKEDSCTWDEEYNSLVQNLRDKVLSIATERKEKYTVIPMQGSGTFSVEGVLTTVVGENEKVLIISNGAYGDRMEKICRASKVNYEFYKTSEKELPKLEEIENILLEDSSITHLAVVHCETTTGILNPIKEIGELAKRYNKVYIVDAMSSFGGVKFDINDLKIDYLISSANKCIQGVPGFGFIIGKIEELKKIKGQARSHSLDIYDQWEVMEKGNGKWRFTSPTHVVKAFYEALLELEKEGGVEKREKRYRENQRVLSKGMKNLGFETLIDEAIQSPIITTFLAPKDKNYSFNKFYKELKEKGFIIYPGKLTEEESFRIGNIGEIYPKDMERLIDEIKK